MMAIRRLEEANGRRGTFDRRWLLATVIALLLAACGSDGESSSTASEDATAETSDGVDGGDVPSDTGAATDEDPADEPEAGDEGAADTSGADDSESADEADETALDLSGDGDAGEGDEARGVDDGGAASEVDDESDGSAAGRGGGDLGDCVGTWFLDTQVMAASLEAVLAAQGVPADYVVNGVGTLEIRDDGFTTVTYDEIVMLGQIEGGSLEVDFAWAATGFIVDGELALEGFEEPSVDAAMFIAGERFDMNDFVADLDLTAGFASIEPVAVECADDGVALVPDDPVWTLRFF